jgi:D-alanyl-lipoteichoic acid acyltransferase DltB (MBOAT superfamily)
LLFNSYHFLFIFLPLALGGYWAATRVGPRTSAIWLAVCSFAFYGVWNPAFLILLGGSIVFNYTIGTLILRSGENERRQSLLLALGITGDLSLLFFFKYFGPLFNFASHAGILHSDFDLNIVLPLGISFFTFTQIGYLVDCREGLGKDLSFVHYVVFVSFFPHLIAGPILHIREIAPQICNPETYKLRAANMATGFTYFVMGLSKKVLLADPLAQLADLGFGSPDRLMTSSAWAVALNYSVQLYFDFSGYSDMAIGLAQMFGIKFPLNFDSPYKATNIINFWQRWHMTLTRYLTLLLFNPIALWATRRRMAKGKPVRGKQLSPGAFFQTIAVPTTYTMFLAGVWHGAGMQFIVFGLLHAFYLCTNHAWRAFGPKAPPTPRPWPVRAVITTSQVALTYLCVLVAQVFFRASSVDAAMSMLAGMVGLHGFEPIHVQHAMLARLGGLGQRLRHDGWITTVATQSWPPKDFPGILLRFLIVFLLPNTQQIMARFQPYLAKVQPPRWGALAWRPTAVWAGAIALLATLDLMSIKNSTVFLYFQF